MIIKSWIRSGLATMAAVLLASAGSGAMAGETLDRVMANGKLVLAVDAEYPPFSYLDENNEMAGFDVDVAKEFASRLGVELEVVTPGWDVITAGKWAGRWDICIGSMTPTAARAEVVDFPTVYYYTPASVIVHQDNTSITSAEDLNGKRVGAQAATTYENYLRGDLVIDAIDAPPVDFKVTEAEIIAYESEPLALEDLSLGDGVRLDAMVTGMLTTVEAIKAGKPLKIVGDPVFMEPIAVAIDKGDPEFAAKIVEIFDAMRADGTLARLSEERLGADITQPPGS
ncbi:MAG: transporter substrate-binding domain-containing protein [Rhodospirillaceae bacterium]|nr:transporter substrate-binding domain-containing protein [Rhodospirillaceae bacterium]